jgi:hypothetical protein
MNRLIPLYTPLFFGWTISLNDFILINTLLKTILFLDELSQNRKKAEKFRVRLPLGLSF